MATFGSKEYNDVLKNFKAGQRWLNDVEVEIVGGENELDPLVLLRSYEADPSLEVSVGLATDFCMNKEVRFIRDKQVLMSFVYNGGDLGAYFKKAPYLMNVLLQACFALMVKKLTPPSEDSENEERQ